MTVFTEHLLESNRDLWVAMAGHPFVLGLADGTLLDSALQAWVQQDQVFVIQERRMVAALRAHGLPSRLDELLAHLDRSLAVETEAFTRTAPDIGFAPEVEPRPVCRLPARWQVKRLCWLGWPCAGGGRPPL